MISHGKDLKIFAGKLQPKAGGGHLPGDLGTSLGDCEAGAFSDGENFVSIYETVRGSDVFVVQSTSCPRQRQPDGDAHHDRRSEAGLRRPHHRGDALFRLCPPGPQDQAPRPHFRQAGGQPDHPRRRGPCAHHGPARQSDSGLLRYPGGQSAGLSRVCQLFHKRNMPDCQDQTMVVSPDVGSVARARAFAQKLDMPMAIVDKRRQKANSSEVMNIIGDVKDKNVILLDDMVDTGRLPVRRGQGSGGDRRRQGRSPPAPATACCPAPPLSASTSSVLDEVLFLDTIPAQARCESQVPPRSSTSPWPTCSAEAIEPYLRGDLCLQALPLSPRRAPSGPETYRGGPSARPCRCMIQVILCYLAKSSGGVRLAHCGPGQPRGQI